MMKKIICIALVISLISYSAVFAESESKELITLNNEISYNNDSSDLLSEENEIDFDKYETWANWHKVTGYAALGLGLAAGILNPKIVNEDLHCAIGYAASGMSAISLGTGAVAYMNLGAGVSDGIRDPHVVLGILGGALMVSSSLLVTVEGHEAAGVLGTLLMGASIVITY